MTKPRRKTVNNILFNILPPLIATQFILLHIWLDDSSKIITTLLVVFMLIYTLIYAIEEETKTS